MSELLIKDESAFKIAIANEIQETDIFLLEYQKAANMLNEIIDNTEKADKLVNAGPLFKTEYANNVIAFCGERGEGKSSAMFSFTNEVMRYRNKSILDFTETVKNTYFSPAVLIDPSQFDDVHNILDIVIANMYQNFTNHYQCNNLCVDERTRESLIDQFQKVYKYLSLINNKDKLLDSEYDYEGNIGKLSRLGESTRLKEELRDLIRQYTSFMHLVETGTKTEGGKMILAIDDLDLCCSEAYRMAEQIRKYLILPNVVIVMAIKLEQLQLCVEENNRKAFRENVKSAGNEFNYTMFDMAERYIIKLIPIARRIYLPKLNMLELSSIQYINGKNIILDFPINAEYPLKNFIFMLIKEKTGLIILDDNRQRGYLVPAHLREFVHLVSLLGKMETDSECAKYNNLCEFMNYFEYYWLPNNLNDEQRFFIKNLLTMDSFFIYETIHNYFTKKTSPWTNFSQYTTYNHAWLLEELQKQNTMDNMKLVYAIKIAYTIVMQKATYKDKSKIPQMLQGYLWGNKFDVFMHTVGGKELDATRFHFSLDDAIEVIDLLQENLEVQMPDFTVTEDDNVYEDFVSDVLIGLLTNTYIDNGVQHVRTYERIITEESEWYEYVEFSFENYFVNILNLEQLYGKLNVWYTGISYSHYQELMNDIKIRNQKLIHALQVLASNIDLAEYLSTVCSSNRCYIEDESFEFWFTEEEERGEIEAIVTEYVKHFIEILCSILNRYLNKDEQVGTQDFFKLKMKSPAGEDCVVDMLELYSSLFVEYYMNHEEIENQLDSSRRKALNDTFISTLHTIQGNMKNDEPKTVSKSLRNRTITNVKNQLDNLAWNLARYYAITNTYPVQYNEFVLCAFYDKIAELYVKDEGITISSEMYQEYKKIVAINNELQIPSPQKEN